MRKILVCQHVAYEPLGTLDPLLKREGFRIRYINFGRDPNAKTSLEGHTGLVILGGPMNVEEADRYPHLTHEVALIQEAVKKNMPVLGICLGAQLVAQALGAKVGRHTEKEIGWYDISLTPEGRSDPVLQHLSPKEKLFQWHGYTFEVPKGGVSLASSEACKHQAFRYGEKVYGFQFHLEVDEPMIERWLKVPSHLEELKGLQGKIDPKTIQTETPLYIGRLKALSEVTFGEFVKIFGSSKKFQRLSCR